jgi:hypothetical protein
MCCFSRPVLSVDTTRIFARPTGRGTQFLAYQMKYESREENAMILPVPIKQPAREDSLRFIDLKEYDKLFADLESGFPYTPPSRGIGCSDEGKSSTSALMVYQVGNYIASFVPTIKDFSRLDARFWLPEETWSKQPQYAGYGFAVFQLASGKLKPHPMAFEFETAETSVYFPTLHIHDGEIHETEEFDHVLYLQHAGLDSRVYPYRNADVRDRSTGIERSKFVAKEFCDAGRSQGVVNPDLLVHRVRMIGKQPNRDTVIAVIGDPTTPTLNLRGLLRYWPWLVVAAGVTWLFARRSKLKRMRAASTAGDFGTGPSST